jgi:hypothetical protein
MGFETLLEGMDIERRAQFDKQVTELSEEDQALILNEYLDVVLATPVHPIVLTSDGVIRWKADPCTVWITGQRPIFNDMAVAYGEEKFDLESYMRFYQRTGYSLCGFVDIFGEKLGLFEKEK